MARLPQNSSKNPARDRCGTPAYAVEPLLPYLDDIQTRLGRQLVVWESAAGEGLLAGYLRRAGYRVIATDYSTDASYLGDDVTGGFDRFRDPNTYPPMFDYDLEITNVPFSLKVAWLKKACESGKRFALLMPSNTRFTSTAVPLFNDYSLEMLSPLSRVDYKMPMKGWKDEKGNSSAQFHSSWICSRLYLGNPIVDVPILKGKAREKAIAKGTHASRVD